MSIVARLRLLAVLGALVGAARADQVTFTFSGKVASIQPLLTPDVQAQLALLNVTVGAPATVTLVIEASVPGGFVSGPFFGYEQYDMAVVDVQLSAGNWEAHFAPPAGQEATNFVQVADNVDLSKTSDLWLATALGVDSGAVLSASPFEDPLTAFGTLGFQFQAAPPKASSNTDLVQELSLYKTLRLASFTGDGGALSILLDLPSGNLSKDPVAIAKHGELLAGATMSRTVLRDLADIAQAPFGELPNGKSQAELLVEASDAFLATADAAMNLALKKTGTTPPGWSDLGTLKDYQLQTLGDLAAPVKTGENQLDPNDRLLRATLLRAMATKCRADLKAQAKNVAKPAADKLVKAEAASHAKLVKAFTKALSKAAAKNVVYPGPSAETVAAGIADFVQAFADMTAKDLP